MNEYLGCFHAQTCAKVPKISATSWISIVTMHIILVQSTKLAQNSSFMPKSEFWSFPHCYAAQNTPKSPLNVRGLKMASKFTPYIPKQIDFKLGFGEFLCCMAYKENIKIGTTQGKTTQIDP